MQCNNMLCEGGLAAVIYTDTLQAFVMIIGASILTTISTIRSHYY